MNKLLICIGGGLFTWLSLIIFLVAIDDDDKLKEHSIVIIFVSTLISIAMWLVIIGFWEHIKKITIAK